MLSLFNIGILTIRIIKRQILLYDLYARWQECAYVLNRVYPYNIKPGDVIKSIGTINPYMVTVPWAWMLGNVINPGFLPYELVKVYALVICIITIIISAFVANRYILSKLNVDISIKYKQVAFVLFALVIITSQYPWTWGIMMGNQGILVGCMLFICTCIYEEHPYITGVILAISMIKPQIAMIFVFSFLFMKRYKVFLTTFIVGVISYLGVIVLTGTDFFKPIIDTVNAGTSLGAVFFGMFDCLKYFNISTNIILILDIAAGILYLIWYVKKINYMEACDSFTVFSGVAIVSTFWFYKQPHDYNILIIPLFLLLKKGLSASDSKKKVKFLVLALSIVVNFYIQAILKSILVKLTGIDEQMIKEIVMTIACFYFMWIGYMCIDKKEKSN